MGGEEDVEEVSFVTLIPTHPLLSSATPFHRIATAPVPRQLYPSRLETSDP